jgi:hypothetical protein
MDLFLKLGNRRSSKVDRGPVVQPVEVFYPDGGKRKKLYLTWNIFEPSQIKTPTDSLLEVYAQT